MLMLAMTQVNAAASPPPPHVNSSVTVRSILIHLEENKLFVQVGHGTQEESTRWILDTGATNHMTGARSAFSELDAGVHGTVKFGDGSIVDIEGHGTVVFKRKSGEHQALAGVYHIPRLTANIISLG